MTTTYTYDSNGNMIQKSDGTNTYTYGYDYENRMISFDAPGTANDAIYVYAIDSWERLSKTVNGATTKYFRDGPNVIAEYDANNTLIATYLEGLNTDEHISKTIGTNTYRYFTDHLESIRQFVDSSQVVQNSYDYSSFGEVFGTPTENVSNAYCFTGRRCDSESSSQYHRRRSYFADLGRWNRNDPEGFIDGENLYVYVKSNPSQHGDPTGLYELIVLPSPRSPWLPSLFGRSKAIKPGFGKGQCPGPDAKKDAEKRLKKKKCKDAFKKRCKGSLDDVLKNIPIKILPYLPQPGRGPKNPGEAMTEWQYDFETRKCTPIRIIFTEPFCKTSTPAQLGCGVLFELGNWCQAKANLPPLFEDAAKEISKACGCAGIVGPGGSKGKPVPKAE